MLGTHFTKISRLTAKLTRKWCIIMELIRLTAIVKLSMAILKKINSSNSVFSTMV